LFNAAARRFVASDILNSAFFHKRPFLSTTQLLWRLYPSPTVRKYRGNEHSVSDILVLPSSRMKVGRVMVGCACRRSYNRSVGEMQFLKICVFLVFLKYWAMATS
jgi:hypothetical protein